VDPALTNELFSTILVSFLSGAPAGHAEMIHDPEYAVYAFGNGEFDNGATRLPRKRHVLSAGHAAFRIAPEGVR
jgi:hypothetical protein